jgi:hypothetical protein
MKRISSFFSSSCRALVLGSSGAIGTALTELLIDEIGSSRVVRISRSIDGLDLLDPKSIIQQSEKQSGYFRLILDATGGLEIEGVQPEKSFKRLEYENMVKQFKLNAIGPALLIKHFSKFLPQTGKSVFATLSARVGSIDDNLLGGWISYRSSKAALNQIVKTASIELSRNYPDSICVALHPGTVKSNLTSKYLSNHKYVMPSVAARNILDVVNCLNTGQSGGFYDYTGSSIPW